MSEVAKVDEHGSDDLVDHLHVNVEPANEGIHARSALETVHSNLGVSGLGALEEDGLLCELCESKFETGETVLLLLNMSLKTVLSLSMIFVFHFMLHY